MEFDRATTGREARQFFDDLWADSDPGSLDESELDQRRYRRQAELLGDRRYSRALEIGCAGGSFTRTRAPLCDELVALDISPPSAEGDSVYDTERVVEVESLCDRASARRSSGAGSPCGRLQRT